VSDAIPDHAAPAPPVDLDRVERDLEGVEAAMARLDAGTYWSDEITGAPLSDELLAADPVARRALERDGA
jgi:RNA polymerase-binding transcription factor DksA